MTIDSVLATADREWRALGVHQRDRATLGADLRADLEAADADGLTPAELLGTDPAGFARNLAEEAGVERTTPRYGALFGVATAGAVIALVVGYVVVLGLHQAFVAAFDLPRGVHVPVWLAAGAFYGGIVAIVVAGAVVAVRVALRDVPRIRHTAARMTVLLPPAFGAGIAAAVAVGWALDFRLTPAVISAEAALVLLAFLGATALARRWSVYTPLSVRESAEN
ncbi:hypothetical protein [Paractinoplanes atraurantiacus]|uniref:Uncharacterized protein n=1 Tax=Paractinoplanes atraurantiacus TaxID=1036182 RepID=A0A285I562_9ACTN|nr:hypothetical protein [Actinoplanes atraurantiacus]SNY42977.1 hypothetical protein SAMN05421748_106359 [Actinoplanes atraurantiacus]